MGDENKKRRKNNKNRPYTSDLSVEMSSGEYCNPLKHYLSILYKFYLTIIIIPLPPPPPPPPIN
jgi:hypothetical protein